MIYNNLNNDSSKIFQPEQLKIELMEHQKTIINAMMTLENNGYVLANSIDHYSEILDFKIETNIGILADRVGAGKSLMIISLLLVNKTVPNRNQFWEGTRYVCIKTNRENRICDINLLIVPNGIINQWINFFKLCPSLKLFVFKDGIENLNNYDVVLLSSNKLTCFNNLTKNIKWKRIIIDEIDTIKLPPRLNLSASFIWLVTATPNRLRYSQKNKKKSLSDIFENIEPWVFEYLIVKNNNDFLNQSIVLPCPRRFIIKCLTPIEISIIKNLIPTNIMAMINAGNTEQAIKILNCNVDTNENILQVITKNIKEALDNKYLELELQNRKQYKLNSTRKIQQIKIIEEIKKGITRLEIKYKSIKERIYKINSDYCPICMDKFNKPTVLSCCNNIFCFECITLASNDSNKCPFCNHQLYKENIHIINNLKERKTIQDNKCDKIDALMEILKRQCDYEPKFLIFANYSQTFKKIKLNLDINNISNGELKGNADIITDTIKLFEDGQIKVLMLNASNYGAGLNLQMATDVIIYHRFNMNLEEQIIGRAQRLGRKSRLNLYYLIHDNEKDIKNDIEEIDYYNWLEVDDKSESIETSFNYEEIDIKNLDKIKKEIINELKQVNYKIPILTPDDNVNLLDLSMDERLELLDKKLIYK